MVGLVPLLRGVLPELQPLGANVSERTLGSSIYSQENEEGYPVRTRAELPGHNIEVPYEEFQATVLSGR